MRYFEISRCFKSDFHTYLGEVEGIWLAIIPNLKIFFQTNQDIVSLLLLERDVTLFIVDNGIECHLLHALYLLLKFIDEFIGLIEISHFGIVTTFFKDLSEEEFQCDKLVFLISLEL
jgi:hypothetical protein